MKKLLLYLNSLKAPDQIAFAKRCGTSVGYLRKAVSIDQRLGANLVVNIERESKRIVTCEDLRPDIDWAVIRNPNHTAAA